MTTATERNRRYGFIRFQAVAEVTTPQQATAGRMPRRGCRRQTEAEADAEAAAEMAVEVAMEAVLSGGVWVRRLGDPLPPPLERRRRHQRL
jgi:hypothetical protein